MALVQRSYDLYEMIVGRWYVMQLAAIWHWYIICFVH